MTNIADGKNTTTNFLDIMTRYINGDIKGYLLNALSKNPEIMDTIIKYIMYENKTPDNEHVISLSSFSSVEQAYNWIYDINKSGDDDISLYPIAFDALTDAQRKRASIFIYETEQIYNKGREYILKLLLLELTIIKDFQTGAFANHNDIAKYYMKMPSETEISTSRHTLLKKELKEFEESYEFSFIAKLHADHLDDKITAENSEELLSDHIHKKILSKEYKRFNLNDFIKKDISLIHLGFTAYRSHPEEDTYKSGFPLSLVPYYAFLADTFRVQENIFTRFEAWLNADVNNLSNRWDSLKEKYIDTFSVAKHVMPKIHNERYMCNIILIDHILNLRFLKNIEDKFYKEIMMCISPEYFNTPELLYIKSGFKYSESAMNFELLKLLCIINADPDKLPYKRLTATANDSFEEKERYMSQVNYKSFLYDYLFNLYENSNRTVHSITSIMSETEYESINILSILRNISESIKSYDSFKEYSSNKIDFSSLEASNNTERLIINHVLNYFCNNGILSTL